MSPQVNPSIAVSGTVAPGFEFADFRFTRNDANAVARLERLGAQWLALL